MLEVVIEASEQYLDCILTLALESDKSKQHNFMVINQRIAKRVIFIPAGVKSIHLTPTEKLLTFSIRKMTFVKLNRLAAYRLMHKKLLTYKPGNLYHRSLQVWRHYEQLYRFQHKSETDYSNWIKKREFHQLKRHLHINTNSAIDIVICYPYGSSASELGATIESIQLQTYPYWTISLVSDERTDKDTLLSALPERLANSVTTHYSISHQQPLFINGLLKTCEAQYLLNVVSGSKLSPYALSIYSRASCEGKADLLYSDHDFLDQDSTRHSPQFKPDWNPDLMLSTNFVGNHLLLSRKLISDNPHIALDQYGVWTYELLIQAVFSSTTPKHITHILTHQRSSNSDQSQKTTALQHKILEKYTCRYNVTVNQHQHSGIFKIKWPVNKTPTPTVSIIIPTRDGLKTLKRAIDSLIAKTSYPNYEILIVDNQSKEASAKEYLRQLNRQPNIQVLSYNKPFNYSAINNFAVKYAKGDLINLLNNDVEIINPSWLDEMVSHATRPDVGCVGAKLYYPDGRIQHGGVIVGLSGCAGHSHKFYPRDSTGYMNRLICTQNYSAVTGACLMLRKTLFMEVGGLNEKDLKVAFNDVDLCLKVQALGYRNVWTPWAELYHYESLSRGQDDTKQKRQRLTTEVNYMKRTWHTTALVDPFYSQYLTKLREDFSLGL